MLALWQLVHWAVGPDVVSVALGDDRAGRRAARDACVLGPRRRDRDGVRHRRASSRSSAGIAIGLWLGLRRFAGDVADPILGTLYSIPKITLYPIILLMFGLGISAKIAFGVIHGIFPIAIFTMNAVRNVAPVYHRTARVHAALAA